MGIFQFQCCGVDNWNDWSKYNSLFQTAPPVFDSPDPSSNSRPDFNKDPQPVDKRRVPKSCCQAGSKLVIQFWKELKAQLRLLPKNFFVTFCQKKVTGSFTFQKKKKNFRFRFCRRSVCKIQLHPMVWILKVASRWYLMKLTNTNQSLEVLQL